MEVKEAAGSIDTRLVYGLLEAGKTTYIRECIQNDTFYRRGRTLILCFEQGEEEYSEDELAEKNASVAFYEDGDVRSFCEEKIEEYHPGRIYVEMNSMMQGLRDQLPEVMRISFVITFIDWATMPVYYLNFMQMMKQMVSESHQVIFRGCPSKELLEPYSQAFRLMNPKASYLRQDPMGYHEKAFSLFLPFSLDEDEIEIDEKNYLPFWLDALDHPEHYDGKTIHFKGPFELKRADENDPWSIGRIVMTCCMADLQFMSFEIMESSGESYGDWASGDMLACVVSDVYGQRKVKLKAKAIQPEDPPEELILDGRRQ